ncbi:hypothetical protein COCCADRAFT_89536 [Bipolaris zeicola 26-R-13]|uniref:Secreted protein n=1 Tax=Cochliobolus carbonum (strain 26-R-13) TaxID=930089 RepID=W6YJX7_COCC2|nr:uncharacterized protein COCCADRAFT_89536 [Bipolaris zeicola 26-R-13]EUC35889.1 hypothetical protein COCCADRAFT_89536 [Bipolaris zeicola 26-R-13]
MPYLFFLPCLVFHAFRARVPAWGERERERKGRCCWLSRHLPNAVKFRLRVCVERRLVNMSSFGLDQGRCAVAGVL